MLLSSCGGSDLVLPVEGEPARVVVLEGEGQSGRAGEPLAVPLVARVTDEAGRPVRNARVVIELDGATVDPDTAVTDGEGLVQAALVLGPTVGTIAGRVRVLDPGDEEIAADFTVTALPASAIGLRILSGDGQTGTAGTTLADPLVVEVTDAFGNPLDAVVIVWSVEGGGDVSDAETTTGPDGRASVTRTLGVTSGPQATIATSEGLAGSPATFTHTAVPGVPASVSVVSGQGQVGTPGTALADSLVVLVTDEAGNPTGGVPVTWVVTDGAGTVSPAVSFTDELGMASTSWTLGTEPGANVVDAVVSGLGSVEFSAVASQPGAPLLALVRQPSAVASVGEAMDRQPIVQLRAATGADVRTPGVLVTAAIASGDGRLTGLVNRNTDEAGRATFRDLAIDGPPGTYTLVFTADGFLPVVSESVQVQ